MASARTAFNYSSSIANMLKENSRSFRPLLKVGWEYESILAPVREQMRINASITESFRDKMIIDQSFFDSLIPKIKLDGGILDNIEATLEGIKQTLSNFSSSFSINIIDEINVRQLYFRLATAQAHESLDDAQKYMWEQLKTILFKYSNLFSTYGASTIIFLWTLTKILDDPSDIDLELMTQRTYRKQVFERKDKSDDKDRDTE